VANTGLANSALTGQIRFTKTLIFPGSPDVCGAASGGLQRV
jgi:hypothetical protein